MQSGLFLGGIVYITLIAVVPDGFNRFQELNITSNLKKWHWFSSTQNEDSVQRVPLNLVLDI